MSVRPSAALSALWSLRGPVEDERAPTLRALRYRAEAPRGVAPLLDAWIPAVPDGRSVVLIHGGGFVVGARTMKPARLIASRLCDQGVAAASIDYRLIFRGGRLDEALDDVRAALAFWRAAAPSRGLDPTRVSLLGLSAGGTLAMLAGAAEGDGVHRVISCFGVYAFDHLRGPLDALMPRLLFRTADRARWQRRAPLGAAQPAAPTLLVHGTADALVPYEQAERLNERRAREGLPTRLVRCEGAPHAFFNEQGAHATRALAAISRHLDDPAPTSA